ncbi:hypothetical protein CEXT_275971 [Caerostris extrusa]|uniref:Uncharacterized protein n=1 Tax=Caerostris extrusa TaxID=172846 RepID=A0AAV4NE71_CAEEX|nr:hypothetical protein CEXT_275971 [Caerostris extrusa]
MPWNRQLYFMTSSRAIVKSHNGAGYLFGYSCGKESSVKCRSKRGMDVEKGQRMRNGKMSRNRLVLVSVHVGICMDIYGQ